MMVTVEEAWRRGVEQLRDAGVDSPDTEARYLLGHATGLSTAQLMLDWHNDIDGCAVKAFEEQIGRRAAGEPYAYIVGEREFFGRRFMVDSRVLIPRPETEVLVKAVLDKLACDNKALVAAQTHGFADLCTGSGAIGITLLCEYSSLRGYLTDISSAALQVAAHNCRSLGVCDRATLARGDLFDALGPAPGVRPVGLVTANPPYVTRSEYETLPREIRAEPANALVGGADGLDAIRRIISQAAGNLVSGGWLFMEIGAGQDGSVHALIREDADFDRAIKYPDLSGIIRVIAARRR